MADQTANLSSTYPLPPSYFQYFTDGNVEKVKEWQKKTQDDKASNGEPPFPLNLLVPPKKPDSNVYRSFGNQWQFDNTIMSLKDVGIQQLYQFDDEKDRKKDSEDPDHTKTRSHELKKLVHSLLIKFVELCGVISIAPEQFPALVEEIRIILINTHHLMNEYRPHQSRESLLILLQQQIDKTKDEVGDFRKKNDEIRERIAGLTKRFKQIGQGLDATQSQPNQQAEEIHSNAQQNQEPAQSSAKEASSSHSMPPVASTLTLTAKSLDQLSWGLLDHQ